jgi:hypothetical protein
MAENGHITTIKFRQETIKRLRAQATLDAKPIRQLVNEFCELGLENAKKSNQRKLDDLQNLLRPGG